MKTEEFSKTYEKYKKVIDELIGLFLEKNFEETDINDIEWCGDGYQTFNVGDFYFNVSDVLIDLKENAPKEEIFKWYDYDIDCHYLGMTTLNYYSWLHNAPRHTEEDMKRIRQLHNNVLEAQAELEKTLKEYNDTAPF